MSELFNFLNERRDEDEKRQTDWEKVKEEWIIQLSRFMKDIETWLATKSEENLISISSYDVAITEEYLGTYEAPGLLLTTSSSRVTIEPVGRLIIGAEGRVDIRSFADEYIVLNDPVTGWKYRNVLQINHYQPFTKENFATILKDLLYAN